MARWVAWQRGCFWWCAKQSWSFGHEKKRIELLTCLLRTNSLRRLLVPVLMLTSPIPSLAAKVLLHLSRRQWPSQTNMCFGSDFTIEGERAEELSCVLWSEKRRSKRRCQMKITTWSDQWVRSVACHTWPLICSIALSSLILPPWNGLNVREICSEFSSFLTKLGTCPCVAMSCKKFIKHKENYITINNMFFKMYHDS
jgi:hypothetical protein